MKMNALKITSILIILMIFHNGLAVAGYKSDDVSPEEAYEYWEWNRGRRIMDFDANDNDDEKYLYSYSETITVEEGRVAIFSVDLFIDDYEDESGKSGFTFQTYDESTGEYVDYRGNSVSRSDFYGKSENHIVFLTGPIRGRFEGYVSGGWDDGEYTTDGSVEINRVYEGPIGQDYNIKTQTLKREQYFKAKNNGKLVFTDNEYTVTKDKSMYIDGGDVSDYITVPEGETQGFYIETEYDIENEISTYRSSSGKRRTRAETPSLKMTMAVVADLNFREEVYRKGVGLTDNVSNYTDNPLDYDYYSYADPEFYAPGTKLIHKMRLYSYFEIEGPFYGKITTMYEADTDGDPEGARAGDITVNVYQYKTVNTAPTITVNSNNLVPDANGNINIKGNVTDADGDNVTVSAVINGVTRTVTVNAGSGAYTLSWHYTLLGKGPYNGGITIKADDGNGGIATTTYTGTITLDAMRPYIEIIQPYYTGGPLSPNLEYTVIIHDYESTPSIITSGLKRYRYIWTQSTNKPTTFGSWITATSLNKVITHSGAGEWYLHVEAEDKTGNLAYQTSARPTAADDIPPKISNINTVTKLSSEKSIVVTWTAFRDYTPEELQKMYGDVQMQITGFAKLRVYVEELVGDTWKATVDIDGNGRAEPYVEYLSDRTTLSLSNLKDDVKYRIRVDYYDQAGNVAVGEWKNIYLGGDSVTGVTGTYGGFNWVQEEGRGWVVVRWKPSVSALGYKVHMFDGFQYREFDVGNNLSWDSRQWKVYPSEAELAKYSDDSVAMDIFNHSKSGLDLRDRPTELYRVTADGSTEYDKANNYWFRVSAYNADADFPIDWSQGYYPTLPIRTDKTAPEIVKIVYKNASDGKSATIEVTASDSGEWEGGIVYIKNLTTGEKTIPKTIEEEKTLKLTYKVYNNGNYKFLVEDKAGRTTSTEIDVEGVNRPLPEIEFNFKDTLDTRIELSENDKYNNYIEYGTKWGSAPSDGQARTKILGTINKLIDQATGEIYIKLRSITNQYNIKTFNINEYQDSDNSKTIKITD